MLYLLHLYGTKFAANNCDNENMKFKYSKEDIDCIVTDFVKLAKDMVDYNTKKMMND